MVNKILELSGFIRNKTCKQTRFIKPPNTTYAVYHDNYVTGGSDDLPLLKRRSITIELYEYMPDDEIVNRLENALNEYYPMMVDGWRKESRYYIDSENIYQTIYEFDYFEKRGE